jgi:hypothetical protein
MSPIVCPLCFPNKSARGRASNEKKKASEAKKIGKNFLLNNYTMSFFYQPKK